MVWRIGLIMTHRWSRDLSGFVFCCHTLWNHISNRRCPSFFKCVKKREYTKERKNKRKKKKELKKKASHQGLYIEKTFLSLIPKPFMTPTLFYAGGLWFQWWWISPLTIQQDFEGNFFIRVYARFPFSLGLIYQNISMENSSIQWSGLLACQNKHRKSRRSIGPIIIDTSKNRCFFLVGVVDLFFIQGGTSKPYSLGAWNTDFQNLAFSCLATAASKSTRLKMGGAVSLFFF